MQWNAASTNGLAKPAGSRVSLTASGQSQSIEGRVCITASEAYSAFLLPPIIAKLRRVQPSLTIEIIASNDVQDLRRREADIAIRNGRPTDPVLIAQKIKDNTAHLYATEGYLMQCGAIQTPTDLSCAHFIGFDNNAPFIEGLNAQGANVTPKHFPVLSSSHLVHWELVKQGVGIGVIAHGLAMLNRSYAVPRHG